MANNSTRLKILSLLDRFNEPGVCDLTEMLYASVSAVSQRLARLRVYGLAMTPRNVQTIYHRLTAHAFLGKRRSAHFAEMERAFLCIES